MTTPKSNPRSISVLALPNYLGVWYGAATSSKAGREDHVATRSPPGADPGSKVRAVACRGLVIPGATA